MCKLRDIFEKLFSFLKKTFGVKNKLTPCRFHGFNQHVKSKIIDFLFYDTVKANTNQATRIRAI